MNADTVLIECGFCQDQIKALIERRKDAVDTARRHGFSYREIGKAMNLSHSFVWTIANRGTQNVG